MMNSDKESLKYDYSVFIEYSNRMKEKEDNPFGINRLEPFNALKRLNQWDFEITEYHHRMIHDIETMIGNGRFREMSLSQDMVMQCFDAEFRCSNLIEGIKDDNKRLRDAHLATKDVFNWKDAVLLAAKHVNPDAPKVRSKDVYLGSGKYVHHTPPSGNRRLHNLLKEWAFFGVNSDLHPLIKAIIGHIQFELIHPLIDGNGRVGRILLMNDIMRAYDLPVPLMLSAELLEPRSSYYKALSEPMFKQDWSNSFDYFLEKVESAVVSTLNTID